ncbi:DUF3558 domain-containing protein [Saccharomonospora cyanea]|uniref:DUF3558 domain-containing protein n=1 Tax=Saccharomonospora cyanea NA-134 TaxID=882082 RepID=H5XRK5_9PSEU|nr:DUF3558 domain-containing protein [Saccharomonospora cyanea]EHR63950.1 Protein of unknown function (DUF3558) [Saccharomonospora cyanea NA-134]
MNRTARAVSVLALVTAASVLTACGDDSAANPPSLPGPAETPASSTAGTGGEAPKVSNPLDAASLVTDPCQALSSSQLDQLGLTEGQPRPNEGLESGACRWERPEGSLDSVDLTVIAENGNGLSALYADKESNEYFEPTEIAGYPAVYASLLDSRDSGICDLWIGVNEREVLHVMTNLASTKTAEASCGLAADVAEAAITTLGG